MTNDVNAQFAAERLRQIDSDADRKAFLENEVAAGRAKKLPGARYKILTGYDAGEVFTAQGMAEHGLDTKANGETALYLANEPAWHGLGQVIPGGLHTAAGVLKAAGLDYTVAKKPDMFTKSDGTEVQIPDTWVTYRTDTEEPFGTVGSIYTVFQNAQTYAFLDELLEHGMVAETAGPFRGGRKTFISARVPEDLVSPPHGVADTVRLYVLISNSHDGSTPVTVCVTPWRPVCSNTERFALRDAKYKITFRHTKNIVDKAQEARETLQLTHRYHEEWAKEETALLQVKFDDNAVDKLIREVWGEPDEDTPARGITDHEVRRSRMHALWQEEKARVGGNGYGAERAVTAYVDHFSGLKPRNDLKGKPLEALGQAILEERQDKVKTKAHAKLMLLTR